MLCARTAASAAFAAAACDAYTDADADADCCQVRWWRLMSRSTRIGCLWHNARKLASCFLRSLSKQIIQISTLVGLFLSRLCWYDFVSAATSLLACSMKATMSSLLAVASACDLSTASSSGRSCRCGSPCWELNSANASAYSYTKLRDVLAFQVNCQ